MAYESQVDLKNAPQYLHHNSPFIHLSKNATLLCCKRNVAILIFKCFRQQRNVCIVQFTLAVGIWTAMDGVGSRPGAEGCMAGGCIGLKAPCEERRDENDSE